MDGQVVNSSQNGSSAVITISDTKKKTKVRSDVSSTCPTCGDKLVFQGGCCSCMSCGFAKCG